jgi:pimeloyl-ACP methyl ester carboxylesterase
MRRIFLAASWVSLGAALAAAEPVRTDFFVESDRGVRIFVREVRESSAKETGPPVLLLHGARVPGLASFDLPVRGASLAADLASAGHAVYVMDARGYGASTRPPELFRSPEESPPSVRGNIVVRDVDAVVNEVRSRSRVEQVALLGWATGGHWLGYYATLHPERVSHLVLLNSLYGGSDVHASIGHGSFLEDPGRPGRFDASRIGAYRLSTAASLFPAWDESIPLDDKSLWRDPAVASAYAEGALASDPTSGTRTPNSFRAPTGALEDSFLEATGHRLWDASFITAKVLVIASENDFWSRPADREALERDLTCAREVRVVVIPGSTHFAHLDRPEHGRKRLLDEVVAFLASER